MRLTPKTIGYVLLMGLLAVAVVFLLSKITRTDLADRRLLSIGAVIAAAILIGGLGALRVRSRSRRDRSNESLE